MSRMTWFTHVYVFSVTYTLTLIIKKSFEFPKSCDIQRLTMRLQNNSNMLSKNADPIPDNTETEASSVKCQEAVNQWHITYYTLNTAKLFEKGDSNLTLFQWVYIIRILTYKVYYFFQFNNQKSEIEPFFWDCP